MIGFDDGPRQPRDDVFAAAVPFPHQVLYPVGIPFVDARDEFPPPDDPRWHTFHGEHEEGKQEGRAEIAGPAVAEVHRLLADAEFVEFLRWLTGYDELVADPDRIGGGIHQCAPGGHLDVHVDFNRHPTRPELVRRVNLILYLSDPDLEGGDLLLVGGVTRRVPADLGTLVVFEASDHSWHGHPQPVRHGIRRSIPAYYYAPEPPGTAPEPARSTTWLYP